MTRLEQLLKLAADSPDDPLARYAVALEYSNQERFDEARAAFEQVLIIDPQYAAAYYHKARVEIRAGDKAAARKTLIAGMQCARDQGDAKTVREMNDLLETIG